MSQSDLVGLVIGLVLGGGYSWWQGRALQRAAAGTLRGEEVPLGQQVLGAVVRLLVIGLVLLLLVLAPPGTVDKWWLTGSFAGAYSVPLFWRLRRVRLRRK
ncbi:hypothetical protein HQ590_09010 [bacterium]|nr:hypothetical protein [bacterium]